MASYFQFDNEDHTALLPKDARTAADLETIARTVEREVIQYFTKYVDTYLTPLGDSLMGTPSQATAIGDGYYVFLRGYRQDAADAEVNANLKLTLRQVIAEVVTWRILQGKTNKLFDGNEKNRFATDGRQRFPNHWSRPLDLFDTRPPIWRA